MIANEQTILKMTVSDIKRLNKGYFFSRENMRFSGDTMRSFGAKTVNGKRYLYRKPSAMVNVFGTWKKAGKDFFGCWEVRVLNGESIELVSVNEETKNVIFNQIK